MYVVGINAHLLSGQAGYRRAGIHVYIEQLLRHLPPDPQRRTIVYTGPGTEVALGAGQEVRHSAWRTERPPWRIAWEQAAWPLAALRDRVDLLHSLAFVTPLARVAPSVVTVYDVSFLHYPETFPRLQRLYLQTQTRRSCRRARRVVVISRSGLEDVHRLLGVPRARIDVVYPGVEAAFRPIPPPEVAAFRARKGLPERFVLHVGTLQPRKNVPLLIDAVARLRDPSLHLVLVGGKGWLYDAIFARVAELGLGDRVHFAGYVPDAELPLWYNAARLTAMPSLYEGFGMPLAQAMACGTPVVAADVSSLPEVVGDAGRLCDPHSAESLAECMANVLSDSAETATLIERGLARARLFSWTRAGQTLARSYQTALAPNA